MAIRKDTLDGLLAGHDPQAVFARDGLFDELKKALAERVLNAEIDDHLDGEAAAIAAFLERHDDLLPIDANEQANAAGLPALAEHQSTLGPGFRLSPRATGTDGFYIATLTRT
jgi:hypothetical protein